jgi:hypothetical protein
MGILLRHYDRNFFDTKLAGSKDFAAALKALDARTHNRAPHWTNEDQGIFIRDNFQIISISPSAAAVALAHRELAGYVASFQDNRDLATPANPNHFSVALWIKWQNHRALLGADLQTTADEALGWMAVLATETFVSETNRAEVFKIPHHGAGNGHCEQIWDNRIEQHNPIAILTTHSSSGTPRKEDVNRILDYTSEAYCTTVPKTALVRRAPVVEGLMKLAGRNRRPKLQGAGRISLFWTDDGTVRVEVHGDAQRLRRVA